MRTNSLTSDTRRAAVSRVFWAAVAVVLALPATLLLGAWASWLAVPLILGIAYLTFVLFTDAVAILRSLADDGASAFRERRQFVFWLIVTIGTCVSWYVFLATSLRWQ